MRSNQTLIALAAFIVAALLSYLGAVWSANLIERQSVRAVSHRLSLEGLDWPHVRADGLQVILTGTAPTEAARFRALTFAGSVIDASRLRDRMTVTPAKAIAPPHFSVEVLRNDDGLSLIGLVPAATGRDAIASKLADLTRPGHLSDMLETASDKEPAGWQRALGYGLQAVRMLPHSKISISAEKVLITANADSPDQKQQYEAKLAQMAPDGLDVGLNISAPRPVIAPFTLRFVIDASGAHFDACSADSLAARDRIIQAAAKAGVPGKIACTIGLGVPTPRWADAVVAGIQAVKALGQGTITFSDTDVSLLGVEGTSQSDFDKVVGDLNAALPQVFSLDATLPKPKHDATRTGPLRFTATLSPEGKLEMRGRLNGSLMRDAIEAYAQAQFGAQNVVTATQPDKGLPDGWPIRVLAGLQAMTELHDGTLSVEKDVLTLSGTSGHPDAKDQISRILSDKLGPGQNFNISVRYDKTLDKQAPPPTPQECLDEIKAAMAAHKINFEPGAAKLTPDAGGTLDKIAAALKTCPSVQMEVAGYTDSQGRAEMNLQLSQSRAEAVLTALMARRVLVGNLSAKGYGEADPIADNGTEAGREANRRIEFHLTGDSADQASGDQTAPDASTPAASGAAASGAATTGAPAPAASTDATAPAASSAAQPAPAQPATTPPATETPTPDATATTPTAPAPAATGSDSPDMTKEDITIAPGSAAVATSIRPKPRPDTAKQ